jgi:hypothetical protein
LTFPEINPDRYKDNSDFEFSDKIIILKKVKSLRQLRRTEKELVRLNYKEAIIKGFTMKGIQQYIATKTKIWIDWSCLEYQKKAEEQENREWYYYMAKDHFAYVEAYRKCIDEIQQYKKEIWNIVMDSKTEHYTRIQALKELHSLSKTYTLLIKDLPFVTNLSKYYDKDILISNYTDSSSSRTYSNNNNRLTCKNLDVEKHSNKLESLDNQYIFNDMKDENALLYDRCLKIDSRDSSKYKQIDDDVMKAMQAQIPQQDTLEDKNQEEVADMDLNNLISPAHWETIRKLRELRD